MEKQNSREDGIPSQGLQFIDFVFGAEVICRSCKKQFFSKVEVPEQRISCPDCHTELDLSTEFDWCLQRMRRPTPNRMMRKAAPRSDMQMKKGGVGRPRLEDARREKHHIMLNPDTLNALYTLNVSSGALFEWLLKRFPPFRSAVSPKTENK